MTQILVYTTLWSHLLLFLKQAMLSSEMFKNGMFLRLGEIKYNPAPT